jgi:hypothetical protein
MGQSLSTLSSACPPHSVVLSSISRPQNRTCSKKICVFTGPYPSPVPLQLLNYKYYYAFLISQTTKFLSTSHQTPLEYALNQLPSTFYLSRGPWCSRKVVQTIHQTSLLRPSISMASRCSEACTLSFEYSLHGGYTGG